MMDRKKIIVVGANGNISKSIIPLLIKHYEVHCLIRSAPSFAINSIFLRFIQGDALSPQTWDQCLEGKHAVISCFGAREGQSEQRHLEFINLVSQKMAEKGVKRLISFFTYGAMNKDIYESADFPNKIRGQTHRKCITELEKTELDFTAICLWKFQQGGSTVQGIQNSWSETPADSNGVATFLQTQLQHPHFLRKTVFLRNNH